MSETIGKRLRIIREKMGLNQTQFSKHFKISQQSVSKYENNQIDIPDDLKLQLLKENINVNWLLSGNGDIIIENQTKKAVLSELENKAAKDKFEIDDVIHILNKIKLLSKCKKEKILKLIESLQDDKKR